MNVHIGFAKQAGGMSKHIRRIDPFRAGSVERHRLVAKGWPYLKAMDRADDKADRLLKYLKRKRPGKLEA